MPSPVIERALLGALLRDWSQLNRERFRGALRAPVMELSGNGEAGGNQLGTWSRGGRTLRIDTFFAMSSPWPSVRDVLLHEMAHQFVDEVYSGVEEAPHGPTFQSVCARFGIDGRASGTPVAVHGNTQSRIVERVRKLLALATSANQHEAEAAMNTAQALLLKYNIDLAATAEEDVVSRIVGQAALRHSEEEKVLSAILTKHFFVKGIWVHVYMPRRAQWGKAMEICGTRENVDMAVYVHEFLQSTTERLWVSQGVGHTRTSLARFRAGAYLGFYQKLSEQAAKHAQTGLVWVGDPRVDEWYATRHPHTRKVQTSGFRRDSDYQQGHLAGRSIVLNRPISESGSRSLQLEDKGR